MHLYTTLYNNYRCRHDWIEAFERNLMRTDVQSYNVFFEQWDGGLSKTNFWEFLNSPKVRVLNTPTRPYYSQFINDANQHYPNDIIVILNADIYFDDTISMLQSLLNDKTCCVLTRIDRHPQNGVWQILVNCTSADVWGFKTPIMPIEADIIPGITGCDAYFNKKISNAGYRMINPCLSIRAYHNHFDGSRNNKLSRNDKWWCYYDALDYETYGVAFSYGGENVDCSCTWCRLKDKDH